ncbi:putative linear gramicidin synthase subunit D [Amylocarpus encephaloides]|uniref:Linear gramicidin synthase subunit D n=1 Tax=Amylocarpus encephaloides TaxID=45428 RepID=A0A9P7YEV7_9HELO|nr:putative linear gramicidin synthase subunit D [Amylocarpus encephaloides]
MAVIDINKDLSALIAQQTKATPDALALEGNRINNRDRSTWTYAELDTRVNDIARRLRAHGVGRDSLVGVLMGRSADYVIACLAALRAGGAFLALELAYPPTLLTDVIEDAKPVVILTHTGHVGQIKADVPLILLNEPESEHLIKKARTKSLVPADNDLERLAFVSYSSGTTGRPKGILNPHRAPVRSYDLRFRLSDLGPGDRVACNVYFIWEIIRPLLRGATVVVVPDESSYDPVALVDVLVKRNITETLMTPTLLAAVLSRHPNGGLAKLLPDLKTLWLNGEVVTTDLARRAMKALPNTRLLNCYSASESHEIACGDVREIIDDEVPYCPVGPPINPEHTYVLDEEGNKVDTGVSGELFVGGGLLARGYLNLPETTSKSFIPDPFDSKPGSLMYRTGDYASILPSGYLEITGRVGAMLKLRGYSVVPGKVENAIISMLTVQNCAVIAHGDSLERQLVAYVVRDKEEPGDRVPLQIDDSGYSPICRKALLSTLAQYMIPALWVELDELPTHEVSGKTDLKRLPSPKSSGSQSVIVEGDSAYTVQAMKEHWAVSLNVPLKAVTKEHTFFDLGGHSLTLAELAARLTLTYEHHITVGSLVVTPTLEGHLEVVKSARDGHAAAVQADLPAVLRADAVLPEEIQPKDAKFCTLLDADTILLTGTTGYLGAFLLADLVESTTAHIICLVRFADPAGDHDAAAVARIRKNLLDLGLWQDSILERIEVIPGNLAQPDLGLSKDVFEDLASNVQVIVHAAATVNLVYPYAALQAPNVIGTREVIRLAAQGGATIQYVSTNGVLPPSQEGWPEDATLEVEDVATKLADGYGQTKWVAEQLIHEAGRRGLPVKILRPGTISGHSTSGSSNAYDLLNAIIVESLHLGYAPDIEGWRAEMTPVDFVSKSILTLANTTDDQVVYHIGDPNPVDTRKLFENLKELGYPTELLSWDKWVELWTEKRGSAKGGESAFTVDILRGGMPTVDFMKGIIVLNDAKTAPALANVQRPKIDTKLLEIYSRHWYARGWLPKGPKRLSNGVAKHFTKRGPLTGKVAVITGASSGIGAAVAEALYREGAHVAIAARRTDALEKVRGKLSSYARGGKVIIHPTDVTKRADMESLLRTTNEKLGSVDILVSCAGVMYFTMMANVHSEDWDRTVDVNCKGLLHCLSSFVPPMLTRGSGHIVAISSDAGRKVFPGLGVYSASKFFVEATLQALRVETAGSGLRVTSVQPGNVATELLGMSTDQEALKKYGEPSGAKVLDADDVARSIVYALRQPEHVAVNEVMIEPRDEPI